MIARLPLETQTLYAELLEHLMGVQAQRSLGLLRGSFTEKQVKGETYVYFQASMPGGTTKQFYVGRRSKAILAMIKRFGREQLEVAPDVERVRRLAAQLRAGGVMHTDAASARVIRALGAAGVFEAGGVLVGTHAFVALGNLLGTRWPTGTLRTQDVDVARARAIDIDLAVPDVQVDLPSVLQSLQMGFLPVPPFDPKEASTSFKVRGQALRVDLLCPKRGDDDAPAFIPRFNAAAQPLDYLDYLLEAPERALVLNGGATLVNVPAPARLALHKLLIAPIRPAALHAKSEKDVAQAADVLEILVEERPGDLGLAWEALVGRGARWKEAAERGLAGLRKKHATLHASVARLLPPAARAKARATR